MEILNYKITKKKKICEINNDVESVKYYLINIKANVEGKVGRCRFVLHFSPFEIQEWLEKDFYTKKDELEYLNEMICCFVENKSSWQELIRYANETIVDYNN